jgi:hypothetical protein
MPFELSALKAPPMKGGAVTKAQPIPRSPDTTRDTEELADSYDKLPEDMKPTKMVEVPAILFDDDAAIANAVEPPPRETERRFEAASPSGAAPPPGLFDDPPKPAQPGRLGTTPTPAGEPIPPSRAVTVAHPELVAFAASTAMELSRAPSLPTAGPELRIDQAGSWEKIWLSLQQREWSSVALVPTGSEISDATIDIAQALCAVGMDHLRQPISVLDVRGVSLGLTEMRIAELRSKVGRGERVLVVVGPVDENPAGKPIAAATDAAILCFKLGESLLGSAKKTIESFGRPRFLGAVALRPRGDLRS